MPSSKYSFLTLSWRSPAELASHSQEGCLFKALLSQTNPLDPFRKGRSAALRLSCLWQENTYFYRSESRLSQKQHVLLISESALYPPTFILQIMWRASCKTSNQLLKLSVMVYACDPNIYRLRTDVCKLGASLDHISSTLSLQKQTNKTCVNKHRLQIEKGNSVSK